MTCKVDRLARYKAYYVQTFWPRQYRSRSLILVQVKDAAASGKTLRLHLPATSQPTSHFGFKDPQTND